jgi:hypothetical protein
MYVVSYEIVDISETSKNPLRDKWQINIALHPTLLERWFFNSQPTTKVLIGSHLQWRMLDGPANFMWCRWAMSRINHKLIRDLQQCE